MIQPVALTRRTLLVGAAALATARSGFATTASQPLLLRAAEATIPLGDSALETPAFNELGAGPALEIERGRPFALKVENALDFPFFVRAQGLRGKAIQGNETAIAPGEIRDITITAPDAGSFVYRAAGSNGLLASRTLLLAGPLIVRENAPPVADRDLLFALNTLILPDADPANSPHRVVTVNGASSLALSARPGERLRLRIVNLAHEGLAALKLPANANVIALDGQPCDPFPPLDGVVVLAPLGRADVVLEASSEGGAVILTDGFDGALPVAVLTIAGEAMGDRTLGAQLAENEGLPKQIPFKSAVRATWKPGTSPPDPLIRAKAGASVVLTFNNTAMPHALLLEGHSARLLDGMDDGWKPWWHDTLLVPPDETARLAFVPETPGRYALDLIPLEGNDAPQRAWIEVF